MLSVIVWFSLFAIFYAYFGYPLILVLLNSVTTGKSKANQTQSYPIQSVTIIIAARNEERFISQKLENTIALKRCTPCKVDILVASDASDDRTEEIVRSFSAQQVELVRSDERLGKEHAQGLAVAKSKGDLILFTDAKVLLNEDAVSKFVAYFADPQVGAVSSTDRIEGAGGSGEGLYIKYEMWLRRQESKFGSLVGLSGSCFCVRREICANWRDDIPSDFSLLLESQKLGLSGVMGEDVVCTYTAVNSTGEEFQRKVRTVLRGITALLSRREVLNPGEFGIFSWQVISHKLFRWLVPWFYLLAWLCSVPLMLTSPLMFLIGAGMTWFSIAAALGWVKPELQKRLPVKIAVFFIASNLGIFIAWLRYLRGDRAVVWTPSAKAG